MKTIIAFALLLACVAQIQCYGVSYSSCDKSVSYTEQHPSGYLEEVYYNLYPYPYAHHGCGKCSCSKCRPEVYTQLSRPRHAYH
uniref:Uncharacterized protein n=1 Tax=Anopheles stephensi TaxID=30069 RepID=A0A182YTG3_ANOST